MSSCAFNGTSCFIVTSCSTYPLNSFASCNLTSDGSGNLCGWATGGVTCKAKACSDAIASPSAATCSAYLSTCAYNGVKCAVAA